MAGPQPQTMPSAPRVDAAPRFERMAGQVSAGSLVARSFEVWWKNLWRFALLTLLVYVPFLAAFAMAWPMFAALAPGPGGRMTATSTAQIWAMFGGGLLVTFFLGLAAVAAYTYGTIQHLSGNRVRMGALLGAGARRAFPVFLAGILVGLAVLGGFVLLVVPGVIVACGLSVAIPAVVVEREGIFASLGRSWRLTRGRRLAIFGAFLLFVVINWSASFATQLVAMVLPRAIAPLALLLTTIVSLLLSSLPAVMPAVAYHDLRVEKEGVVTEDLVKVFE